MAMCTSLRSRLWSPCATAASLVLGVVFLVLSVSVNASAQVGYARIRGTVIDPQQRTVPNAKVILTSELNGFVTTVTSTDKGDYTFPQVQSGKYDLTVNVPGFREFEQKGIILNADQNLTLPVDLTIGNAIQEVTVDAEGTQVDTQTGTIRATIDEKSIVDLPLNGRDPRELIALQQGVIQATATFNSNQQSSTVPGTPFFVVNGSRANTVNYLLDGIDNNDPYTNASSAFPDPDALSEFSVQVSNFDAEYGRNSGAIVNAITKSGTNKLHGSIYEFVRDSTFGLNANDWFSKFNKVPEPFLIQHQFGGSLGGPVVLPRLYNGRNKTFFFGSYQETIAHSASNNASLTVPNASERSGNLSGVGVTIYNPLTGIPFPNNTIPTAQLDPAAQQFINNYLPLPNNPTAANPNQYTFKQPNDSSQGQLTLRGDQMLPKQNRLEMRYYRFTYNIGELLPQPGNVNYAVAGNLGEVDNAALILTTTFTPHLVNLLSYGYAHTYTHPGAPPAGYPTPQTLGLNLYSIAPDSLNFSISGFTGASGAGSTGLPNDRNNFPLADSVNYQFGKHSLAFGGQIVRQQEHWTYNQAFPTFSFTGSNSGYGLADFLLGYPYQMSEGSTEIFNTRFTEWAVFGQDNWKVSDRLTLDLGLRWEPYLPPHFVGSYNPIDVLSPSAALAGIHSTVFPNAPPGLFFAGDKGVPNGGTSAVYSNFSPRVGFSYDLMGHQKTVLRGAYGLFIDQPKADNYNRFTNGQPFNIFEILTNAPMTKPVTPLSPFSWRNPYNGGPDPIAAFAARGNNPPSNAAFTLPVTGQLTYVNFHMPYTQQWNITVEQQLPLNTVGRITYVGSKGTHLQWTRDLNAPQRQAGPSANWASEQKRTPLNPYYGYINGLNWDGYSSYEAIQFNLDHRFSHGLSTTLNYSHSRSFDSNSDGQEFIATGIQDPYNLRLEYGPSDFDVPNNFEGSVLYVLPIPSTHNRVADLFVRGWQTNAIISVHSGQPYSIYVPCDCELNAESYQRARVFHDPRLSQNRPQLQRVLHYFDTTAYYDPALLANPATAGSAWFYTPDNDNMISARNSGRQPGYRNVDLSAFKNFDIEHTEVQFRVQAYNAFNNPGLGVNTQSQYPTSSVFGQLSTDKPGRTVEFAIHVAF